MKLLRRVTYGDGRPYGWSFWCPGCNDRHVIPVEGTNGWAFDGNVDSPTFSPSILVYPAQCLDEHGKSYTTPRCHSFIRRGQWEYCGDSTHALAGQTVPMIELDDQGHPVTS